MSALLCRAVTDVKRIWQLRDSKQALNILVQKGSLGDETVARFAAAEKELEAEVVDVVAEANTFKQGWGQWIFASASEIAQREKIKSVLEGLPKIKQEQGAEPPNPRRMEPDADHAVDRIYASRRAQTTSSPSTPAAVTEPPILDSQSTSATTALESSAEGLLKRAAAGVVKDTPVEGDAVSSGASTPGLMGTPSKGGVSPAKVCLWAFRVTDPADARGTARTLRAAIKRRARESDCRHRYGTVAYVPRCDIDRVGMHDMWNTGS